MVDNRGNDVFRITWTIKLVGKYWHNKKCNYLFLMLHFVDMQILISNWNGIPVIKVHFTKFVNILWKGWQLKFCFVYGTFAHFGPEMNVVAWILRTKPYIKHMRSLLKMQFPSMMFLTFLTFYSPSRVFLSNKYSPRPVPTRLILVRWSEIVLIFSTDGARYSPSKKSVIWNKMPVNIESHSPYQLMGFKCKEAK